MTVSGTNGDTCIVADNMSKSYGTMKAVDGISFSVKRGQIFGFLGPNGAGKSTTIKLLTTAMPIDRGSASVLGMDVSRDPMGVRHRIGVVQQQPSYEPILTVERALDRYGMMWGVPKRVRQKRLESLLDDFGLLEFRKKRNQDLSIGQRRRVQVAREFVHDMDLLFLDEPTVGMDPAARRKLLDYLKRKAKSGLTIFYTTHVLSEVEYLCDEAAIMDRGRILATGTPESLKGSFNSKRTVTMRVDLDVATAASLLAGINGCGVENDGGTVVTIESECPEVGLTEALVRLRSKGARVGDLHSREPSLEDVFLDVVGK